MADTLTGWPWPSDNVLFAVAAKRLELPAFRNCPHDCGSIALSAKPLRPEAALADYSGTQVGLHEETVLFVAWACLVVAGCGLLVGVACRFSAIVAWFFHLCAAKSGGFVSYGMDKFMTIGLFYLMLSPLPDQFSLD